MTIPRARMSAADSTPMTPHDLQQTRMVGEPELLRGSRDVPLVPLERRDDDLPLRLRLSLDERPGLGPPDLSGSAATSSGGTCSAPITSPSPSITIRSTTLRSSRTLLRAQS